MSARVTLNCGGCGEALACEVPASQTVGVVPCRACAEAVDVAHAYRHAPWCVACGEDLPECDCGVPSTPGEGEQ